MVDLNIIQNISEKKTMIKNKKTGWDSLIKQKKNLKCNHENQRKATEWKKAAAASLSQPAAQNKNHYLTPSSTGRLKSIDKVTPIKTITDLALISSFTDSQWRTKVINSYKLISWRTSATIWIKFLLRWLVWLI